VSVSNYPEKSAGKIKRPVEGGTSAQRHLVDGRFPNLYSNNAASYRHALIELGLNAAEADAETARFQTKLGLQVAQSAPAVPAVAQVPGQVVAAPLIVGSRVSPRLLTQPVAAPLVAPGRVPSPRVSTPLVAPAATGRLSGGLALPPMGAGSPRGGTAVIPPFGAPATTTSGGVRL
jgi:hypothetical protein